jgi:hypothetical protein
MAPLYPASKGKMSFFYPYLGPGVFVWMRELNLPVKSSGPHQGWVEDISPVSGSDDLESRERDVRSCVAA